MSQTPTTSTTPDALRAAIANAVQVDAMQLQSAVRSIVVVSSDEIHGQRIDPQIKSLYNAQNQSLTLISDRIPAGQEEQDFANALVLHLNIDVASSLVRPDLLKQVQSIRTGRVFEDAPADTAIGWSSVCASENALSQCLATRPIGQVVVLGSDAWFLEPEDDQLVLMHANVIDGALTDQSSRFDVSLDWVDVSEKELRSYADRVNAVTHMFTNHPSQLQFLDAKATSADMPAPDGPASLTNATWIGNSQFSVATLPNGSKIAVKFGSEETTLQTVLQRLKDGEEGDDVPILMEAFGVDYEKACDVVFSGKTDEATALLLKAAGSPDQAINAPAPAYVLPRPKDADQTWNACVTRTFEPTANQRLVIAAVQSALDAGMYYSSDVVDHCAKTLAITPEQKAANFERTRVEGGIFGMECYYARKYLDARSLHAQEDKAHEQLQPHVGQKLGTIMFNDFKRNTGTVVTKVDGLQLQLQFKRGANTVACETTALTVQHAIDRAAEKNLRKDDFATFTGTVKKPSNSASRDDGLAP